MKRIHMIFLAAMMLQTLACNNMPTETPSSQDAKNDTAATERTKGKLVCDLPVNFFGGAKKGDSITCDFVFVNEGTEPVKIIDYSVSCNCTGLKFSRQEINKGDTLIVQMIIATKEKKKGPHSSTAVIKTNGERAFYDIRADFLVE